MQTKSFTVNTNDAIKPFKKTIKVDSDKSQSIRSFLIGAISQDISRVENVLESDDVYSAIECLKKLGVKIKKIKPKSLFFFLEKEFLHDSLTKNLIIVNYFKI